MRKLDRSVAIRPANWVAIAQGAVPDHALFLLKAQAFEALPFTDPVRRAGFAAFAPDALPRSNGKPGFKAVWGRHKKPIAGISDWQCAYCECSMNSPRVGQVEHFKPKSRFPLAAYDWDNYVLACGGCNGPKGDNWPDVGQYVRPDDSSYDPTLHFTFKGDGDVDSLSPDAARTILDFELRRELLIRDRKIAIDHLRRQIEIVAAIYSLDALMGERHARRILESTRDPKKTPYSTALTQFVSGALQAAIPGFSI